MKPKVQLAKIAQELICQVLEAYNIEFDIGIQHGGGTLNHDSIIVNGLELAITLTGTIEVVNRDTDNQRIYDHTQIDHLLKDLFGKSIDD